MTISSAIGGETKPYVAVRPEYLNILSICTGGAGLDLGFELAIPSARTVCMVEREAFGVAQLVSAMEAGLLAPAAIWSDARTFSGRQWRGAVDGLIGGIPCQPHSMAGRKRGQQDERDLWSDARRIIVQSGAWIVLIENVAGMLSAGADEIAGAERVYRDLRKLGFAVEGGLFTAAEVGAPHQRERVFILAVADPSSWSPERRGGAGNMVRSCGDTKTEGSERERGRGAIGDRSEELPGVGQADAYRERLEGFGADDGAIGRKDEGRSTGLRDRTALGNAEGIVGTHQPDRNGSRRQHVVAVDRPAGRNRDGGGAPGNIPGQREDAAAAGFRSLFPPGPGDSENWERTLERAPEFEPSFRRVADGLASRLDIARVDRLRMLGNGVVPLEAAYAIRTLCSRLAARGSASATRLVRMMEEQTL